MVGVKMASERLRQRSASSLASSRASGGARVRARVEEGDNDRGKCEYINVEFDFGAPRELCAVSGSNTSYTVGNTTTKCSILKCFTHDVTFALSSHLAWLQSQHIFMIIFTMLII